MASSIPLRFDRIVPCVCEQHAVVRLFDQHRGTRVQVRVSATCADAIEACEAGRESLPSSLVDTLVDCLEAGGSVPVELVLAQHSGEALMRLRSDAHEDVYVPVDPGMGYLVAHRLHLSVVLSRTDQAHGDKARDGGARGAATGAITGPDPLAAFRDAVEQMDWPLDESR